VEALPLSLAPKLKWTFNQAQRRTLLFLCLYLPFWPYFPSLWLFLCLRITNTLMMKSSKQPMEQCTQVWIQREVSSMGSISTSWWGGSYMHSASMICWLLLKTQTLLSMCKFRSWWARLWLYTYSFGFLSRTEKITISSFSTSPQYLYFFCSPKHH
jgi:hypothetical protein